MLWMIDLVLGCARQRKARGRRHTESLCQGLCCPLTAGHPSIPGCPPPLITAMTSPRDPDTVSISVQNSLCILHHYSFRRRKHQVSFLVCIQVSSLSSSTLTLLLHTLFSLFSLWNTQRKLTNMNVHWLSSSEKTKKVLHELFSKRLMGYLMNRPNFASLFTKKHSALVFVYLHVLCKVRKNRWQFSLETVPLICICWETSLHFCL